MLGHALLAIVQATNGSTIQNAFSTATPAVVAARRSTARCRPWARRSTALRSSGSSSARSAGIWQGVGPIAFAFQLVPLRRQRARNCTAIPRRDSNVYTLGAKDTGRTIGLTLTATDSIGKATAYASLIGPVAAAGAALTPIDAADDLRHRPRRRRRSTSIAGQWSSKPRSYAYTWLRCNTNGRLCTAIAGATGDLVQAGCRRRRTHDRRRGNGATRPERRRSRRSLPRPPRSSSDRQRRSGGRPSQRASRSRCASALVLFLTFLDNTIVSVALADMQTSLKAGVSSLQWIVDGYMLAFAGLMLTGGTLGDLLGRKKLLLGGVALFCARLARRRARARLDASLIVGRVVMGVGAAACEPGTLSLIRQIYPDDRAARPRARDLDGGLGHLARRRSRARRRARRRSRAGAGSSGSTSAFGLIALAAAAWTLEESADPEGRSLDVPGLVAGAVAVTGAHVRRDRGRERRLHAPGGSLLLFGVAAASLRRLRPDRAAQPAIPCSGSSTSASRPSAAPTPSRSRPASASSPSSSSRRSTSRSSRSSRGGRSRSSSSAMAVAMVVAGPDRRPLDGGARPAAADGRRLPALRRRHLRRRRAAEAERVGRRRSRRRSRSSASASGSRSSR